MKVQYDFPLKAWNTFKMEVFCRRFVCIDTEADILKIAEDKLFEEPLYILGEGSNTLFTKDYEGTIVHPAFKGIEIMENTPDYVILRVAAGETWNDLVQYCIQHRLYGIENLVGIPGLAGSAPVQNIGAYGMEISDCIEEVEGYLLSDMQKFAFTNRQCQFGYRDSIFKNTLKGKCFITHIHLKLSKKEHYNLSYHILDEKIRNEKIPLSLENIAEAIQQIRNDKLPDISQVGCAGCFFQNPIVFQTTFDELQQSFPDLVHFPIDEARVKLSAGQLVEKAGWKGKTVGHAGISPRQALVIVNHGDATPAEIMHIYKQVVHDVYKKFNILLNPEVNIL